MLLYYPFRMFMGFTLHIYIIFGTNLLTGGPPVLLFFLPILVFHKKGTSKRVRTEWNLRERYFWNKRDPGDLEWTSRNNRGVHKVGGAPSTLVGPSLLHRPTSSSYIYTHVPRKHQKRPRKTISSAVTFCIREIPCWGLFRSSTGGGIHHGGLLHQHYSLSDDVWVVYFRPFDP